MSLFRVVGVLFFLSLVGLICTYVYRRVVRDVTNSPLARRSAAVLLALPLVALPVIRLGFATGGVPPWVNVAVLGILGFTFFTMLTLLAVDAGRGVRNVARRYLPSANEASGAAPVAPTAASAESADDAAPPVDEGRRLFLSRAVAAGALTVSGTTSVYGMYRALTPPEITEVPVRLPGLPRALDGFTIVQLSDIHVGAMIQEKFLDVLVSKANGVRPDLIAITGDLVDGSVGQLGRYVARFQNLRAHHGVYFCSGNHDYYSGWAEWAAALPGIGFSVLRNRRVAIGDAGASFDLLGVDDLGARWGTGDYDLDKAAEGRDPERASVLLAHQPANLPQVSAKHIGLQLSGHTHGGQIFPGTMMGSLIWGDRNQGLSKFENTWQFTSRGCGFVAVPMRVGAPPEVVKLVLLAG